MADNDTPKSQDANTPAPQQPASASASTVGNTDMGLVAYIAFAAGFVTGGIGSIVAVVIAYSQRGEVTGSWQESHYDWLIRTFWIGLAAGFVGMLLTILVIGFFLILLVMVWMIVRLVKGWMLYDKKQPIPDPNNLLFG
ncbi:MAG: DUF4870 family protein [Alphaproteobacteria bacterium]